MNDFNYPPQPKDKPCPDCNALIKAAWQWGYQKSDGSWQYHPHSSSDCIKALAESIKFLKKQVQFLLTRM